MSCDAGDTPSESVLSLLGLREKWLQPFDVEDPFTGLALRGFLSRRPDHRYGALAITHVDDRPALQRVFATPKLHYPFDKLGTFRFPPVQRIGIYEKLDGTNVLAYRFRDADGTAHTTYKLRLHPVMRNSRYGAFLDMWREMLDRYPAIPRLPEANGCSVSFELYGSRNAHLMLYDRALDCALLFGIDAEGRPRPPSELDALGVPTPGLLGTLEAGHDPVAEYGRVRAELQAGIEPRDEEMLAGAEGTVWYVTTAAGDMVLFKCKPESVEAIHWAGGINKMAVIATCWNLLETQDELTYEALLPLLAEEYEADEIEAFRTHILDCIESVTQLVAFQNRVLAEYAATGLDIAADKGGVMRALSATFAKGEMRRVHSIIARNAGRA